MGLGWAGLPWVIGDRSGLEKVKLDRCGKEVELGTGEQVLYLG